MSAWRTYSGSRNLFRETLDLAAYLKHDCFYEETRDARDECIAIFRQ